MELSTDWRVISIVSAPPPKCSDDVCLHVYNSHVVPSPNFTLVDLHTIWVGENLNNLSSFMPERGISQIWRLDSQLFDRREYYLRYET